MGKTLKEYKESLNSSNNKSRSNSISCMKNISDCMFLGQNGSCIAEWCIFEELPTVINTTKSLTCSICNETKKTVSTFSGIGSFICDKCNEKIKKVTPDNKQCSICGSFIKLEETICNNCKNNINKTINSNCVFCGTSTSNGNSICSACVDIIRNKL